MSFDVAIDGGNNGGASNNLSWTHTFGTLTNGLCVIALIGDVVTGGADNITSVIIDPAGAAIAAALVGKVTSDPTGGSAARFAYQYKALVGTIGGAKTIQVQAGSSHYLLAGSASYDGHAQSGQPDVSMTNATSANTQTDQLTTLTDACWTMLTVGTHFTGGNTPTAGTGSTRRALDGAFQLWAIFDSNGAISPAGLTSMSWTIGGVDVMQAVMAAYKPVATSGGGTSGGAIIQNMMIG